MDGSATADAVPLLCSLSASLDPYVMTACARASPQKAMNGARTSTLWELYPRVSASVSDKKRAHKIAPRSPSGLTSRGLLGAAQSAGERLSREPAFASQIATDIADLTTMVEMVKQDHGEPGPDFSGIAPARRGEVPVEVRWGERVQ